MTEQPERIDRTQESGLGGGQRQDGKPFVMDEFTCPDHGPVDRVLGFCLGCFPAERRFLPIGDPRREPGDPVATAPEVAGISEPQFRTPDGDLAELCVPNPPGAWSRQIVGHRLPPLPPGLGYSFGPATHKVDVVPVNACESTEYPPSRTEVIVWIGVAAICLFFIGVLVGMQVP